MKILLIRVGRTGDMLMITPAVRALIDHYPNAEFHLLTSRDGVRVFKGFSPRLTTFLLHDRKAIMAGVHLRKLLRQVQTSGYDSAFCFEQNPTFIPFYQAARDGGYCFDNHDFDHHYSRRCLNIVERAIDKRLGDYWLNLPVNSQSEARTLFDTAGIRDNTFVIGLHPTYSGLKKAAWRRRSKDNRRCWPTVCFAELATQLADYGEQHNVDMSIIMDLMPDETAVGQEIVRLSGGKVTMLTPPLDFQRYKATLKRMNVLITTDTGPMHIGGGVGTQLVALFGGTDPDKCGAYVPRERFEAVRSPSQRIADISPQQVFNACQRFLPE